jgi:hypothetical protein
MWVEGVKMWIMVGSGKIVQKKNGETIQVWSRLFIKMDVFIDYNWLIEGKIDYSWRLLFWEKNNTNKVKKKKSLNKCVKKV